jgi:hypothetical protein
MNDSELHDALEARSTPSTTARSADEVFASARTDLTQATQGSGSVADLAEHAPLTTSDYEVSTVVTIATEQPRRATTHRGRIALSIVGLAAALAVVVGLATLTSTDGASDSVGRNDSDISQPPETNPPTEDPSPVAPTSVPPTAVDTRSGDVNQTAPTADPGPSTTADPRCPDTAACKRPDPPVEDPCPDTAGCASPNNPAPPIPERVLAVTSDGRVVVVDSASGEVLADYGGLDDPNVEANEGGPQFVDRVWVTPDGRILISECCEPAGGVLELLDADVPRLDDPDYGNGLPVNDLGAAPMPVWAGDRWIATTGLVGLWLRPADPDSDLSPVQLSSTPDFSGVDPVWLGDNRVVWSPDAGPGEDAAIEIIDFDSDGNLNRPVQRIQIVGERLDSLALAPSGNGIIATACIERSESGVCAQSEVRTYRDLAVGDATPSDTFPVPAGFRFGQTSADTRHVLGTDSLGQVWWVTDGQLANQLVEGNYRWATWIPDGVELPTV